jgi:quercetin dioxygenase-like cupin family protein
MEIIDLKKLIKFYPDKISREMLDDKPEMRIALMCLEPGQKLEPHKAPLRLLMYVVEGKGTFTVGDEQIVADEKTAIPCDPLVPHGFRADKGEKLVVMAVVTPVE